MASHLTLAEAKNQKGQQGALLPFMRETPLPFTAGTPLPRKAKNAPARRRMPQLGEESTLQEVPLPSMDETPLPQEAKRVPSKRKIPLGLAHRWPYNSVACNPLGEFATPTEDPLMGIIRLYAPP